MLVNRQCRLAVSRRLASLCEETRKSLAARFETLEPTAQRTWALLWLHDTLGEQLLQASAVQMGPDDQDCDLLVLQEDLKARQVSLIQWKQYVPCSYALFEDLLASPLATVQRATQWDEESASGFGSYNYLYHQPCLRVTPDTHKATLQLQSAFQLKLAAVKNSWLRLRGRCRFLASNARLRVMDMASFRSLRIWMADTDEWQLQLQQLGDRELDLGQMTRREWCLVESDCDLLLRYDAKQEGMLFLHALDGHCEVDLLHGFVELWSASAFVPPMRYVVEQPATELVWRPGEFQSNQALLRSISSRKLVEEMRVTLHDELLCFAQPDETPVYAQALYSPDPHELHYTVYDQWEKPCAQLRFVKREWTLYFTLVD